VECCRDGCPSGRFSLLHRGTPELCQTDLPDQVLLPRLLSLDRRPALGRVLVVPNFFHLRMMAATVFLGTFNAAEMFWYFPPISVPQPNMHLDKILSSSSSLIAKGVNTYVNKAFFFYIHLQTFLKICFHFVIMGYCV
jgi:hypothetical protein